MPIEAGPAGNDPTPGFYGKVPGLGDFVSRRLPQAFIDPWDAWLQEAIATSRQQLGAQWLDVYLTSPLWRYALSPGSCGERGWAGVLMPSVDRVGRYFPLTIAVALADGDHPYAVLARAGEWFERAETVLLAALDDEGISIADFDREVVGLGSVPVARGAGARTPLTLPPPGIGWRVAVDPAAECPAPWATMLDAYATAGYDGYSLWWSNGSQRVEPSFATCAGLPAAVGFAALLSGDWMAPDWHVAAVDDGETTVIRDPQ